jgi:hypothetical protein
LIEVIPGEQRERIVAVFQRRLVVFKAEPTGKPAPGRGFDLGFVDVARGFARANAKIEAGSHFVRKGGLGAGQARTAGHHLNRTPHCFQLNLR